LLEKNFDCFIGSALLFCADCRRDIRAANYGNRFGNDYRSRRRGRSGRDRDCNFSRHGFNQNRQDGNYTVTFLQPGTYNIAVDKTGSGFSQTVRENIRLEVAQTASIDITLGIAAGQTTVNVEGSETPLLQTETSNLETTIEQRLVEDLPSGERNIFAFVN
jgi:hypothetical protein